MSPAEIEALIAGVGVILSGLLTFGLTSFRIGKWEGENKTKLDQVVVDVAEIKKWDFAKLSSDVSEIKGMFVLRLRE